MAPAGARGRALCLLMSCSLVVLAAPGVSGGGEDDACAAALEKDCAAAHSQGLSQCVTCVQAHDVDLTAAGCSVVEKEAYCAHPGPPPPPPPTPHRPQDSPCVTWQHASCRDLGPPGAKIADYQPAIYTAWQWEGSGNKTNPSGRCVPCSGKQGDFNCGYLFPCFTTLGGMFGHRDICVSSFQGCNAHLAGGNSSLECDHWLAGKGPQWQHFGWQLAQKGSKPSDAIGQLITDPSGRFVLARSPAAIPFAGCGPGVTGWVALDPTSHTLGCMEYDAVSAATMHVRVCAATCSCP